MLREVGAEGALGPDGVPFAVEGAAQADVEVRLRPEDFPPRPDAVPGLIPRVGIGLTAPLFLRSRDDRGQRHLRLRPSFGELFRAALRTVGRLWTIQGEPLSADFRALAEAAERIRLVDHCFEPFRQPHWSSRKEQHTDLRGTVGGAVYADVPLSLLPWLVWGGRLGVGSHRVAGAGRWRIVLD